MILLCSENIYECLSILKQVFDLSYFKELRGSYLEEFMDPLNYSIVNLILFEHIAGFLEMKHKTYNSKNQE